jgi:hypothetical protein
MYILIILHLKLMFHLFINEGDILELLLNAEMVSCILQLLSKVLVPNLLIIDLGLQVHIVIDLILQFVLIFKHFITQFILQISIISQDFL